MNEKITEYKLTDDLKDRLRGQWIKSKTKEEEYLVVGFYYDTICFNNRKHAAIVILKNYTFLDGTPLSPVTNPTRTKLILKKDIVIKAGTVLDNCDGETRQYVTDNFETTISLTPDSLISIVYGFEKDDKELNDWVDLVGY